MKSGGETRGPMRNGANRFSPTPVIIILERTMKKIEQIEKLLSKWKAADELNSFGLNPIQEAEAWGKILGLEEALRILKEPSNTRMQIDGPTIRCSDCNCILTDPLCVDCADLPAHD